MTKPSECPKGLTNISYSTLSWPLINCPSLACWQLWTSTIHTLYTGDTKGTKLMQPLGAWLCEHDHHCFWHWRMADNDHLVYRHNPSTPMRMALLTMQHCTMLKFSPTVPTRLEFSGPPITPLAWPNHRSSWTPDNYNCDFQPHCRRQFPSTQCYSNSSTPCYRRGKRSCMGP